MLVAMLFTYVAWRGAGGRSTLPDGLADVGVAATALLLVAGSRDTLRKYYARVGAVLGETRAPREFDVPPDRDYSNPADRKKAANPSPYKRQNSASSTASTRRSPDSIFETNDA
jgi:hypothetical protein